MSSWLARSHMPPRMQQRRGTTAQKRGEEGKKPPPAAPRPPLQATKTTAMAGSRGTKRDALRNTVATPVAVLAQRLSAVIARRQLGTAVRSSEPLLLSRVSSRTGRDSRGHGRRNTRADRQDKTNLSHDGLNPAHVPCQWVNNPILGYIYIYIYTSVWNRSKKKII